MVYDRSYRIGVIYNNHKKNNNILSIKDFEVLKKKLLEGFTPNELLNYKALFHYFNHEVTLPRCTGP